MYIILFIELKKYVYLYPIFVLLKNNDGDYPGDLPGFCCWEEG